MGSSHHREDGGNQLRTGLPDIISRLSDTDLLNLNYNKMNEINHLLTFSPDAMIKEAAMHASSIAA